MIDPAKDFYNHKWPYEWPYRGSGKPGKYGQLPQGMGWKIKEWTDHLYTIPKDDPYALAPGPKFTWTRIRAVGGRTLLWGRNCDRFGPLDFKPKSLQDGWGEDWPISYDDIAPYYDRVEALIGVSGGTQEVPNTPIGKKLLPPFRPRCGELLIEEGSRQTRNCRITLSSCRAQPALRRSSALPLLWGLQLRLRHGVALQQFGGTSSETASETEFRVAHTRCGSQSAAGTEYRQGSRSHLSGYSKTP